MIRPADLTWRDGQPFSTRFQDIYHDADGSGEVERVFLAPAGFESLLANGHRLLIGELGFGTGLNFTVIARHCLRERIPLHFVSFEASPIAPPTFLDICRDRQTAEPVYRALAPLYPPLLPGWHRRRLYDGLLTLSVFWGAAEAGLAELIDGQRRPFDLWLLDGFAPDRNPAMWSPGLFSHIARTATRGTRVTTFTAAGRVRRGLNEVGFAMHRVDQRPHKRESLAGVFEEPGLERSKRPTSVRIVGAGIAGAAAARELASSGMEVEVLEAAGNVAAGASGIPITVMHPRLHHDGSPSATLKATAWAHALSAVLPYLPSTGAQDTGIHRTGALQIASPNYPAERLAQVAERYAGTGVNLALLTPLEASELAGVEIGTEALWFPDACQLDTPRFTRTLLDHPLIQVRTGITLSDWPAGPAVLACGSAAQSFPGAQYLELGIVHGQLDLVEALEGPHRQLRLPLVGHGYVAPGRAGSNRIGVGATYEYAPWPATEASAQNFTHLERLGPGRWQPLGHHKAPRSVSSDRQPIIGGLYSAEQRQHVGRFVTTGHGSMGTVTSHLGASLLAAALDGDRQPLADPLLALVSPRRFRIRQARRGYRFNARN